MSENIEFPKGVTDEAAYLEYLQAKEAVEKHEQRFYKTSDGKVVDLMATAHIINKQIKDSSQDDQIAIKKLISEFRSLIGKMTSLKRKAWGTLREEISKQTGGLGPLVDRQMEVIELFGRFYTASEIHRIIVHDWGYNIGLDSINNFRKKNIEKITELQKDFEESYSDVRLGKRRSRLDEYTWLYNKTKEKYVSNEAREDAKLMQSLLESIKKEVDGDLVINGKLKVDIEHTINMQVQSDMLKDFNITALIIARLAGRMNVNPMLLLSRLSRSQYAKFTGFGGASKSEMDNDEIYSITNLTYDFDRIVQLNQARVDEENELKKLPQISDESVSKGLTVKEMMMNKVKNHQSKLEKMQQDLDKRTY